MEAGVASREAEEIEGEVPVPFSYRCLGQLVDLGERSALIGILGAKVSDRCANLEGRVPEDDERPATGR